MTNISIPSTRLRRLGGAALAVALLGGVTAVSPAGAVGQTCRGRAATTPASVQVLVDAIHPGVVTVIEGTEGDDVLVGTPGVDVIVGLGGDDIICGLGSADEIDGGFGADILDGGRGNDILSDSNEGQDFSFNILIGGDGHDYLQGGPGRDRLTGGSGNDSLKGNGGNDRLSGGRGNDSIDGGDGRDIIIGGGGDDAIFGEQGNDRMVGGPGDDLIVGEFGSNDQLIGAAGNDLCGDADVRLSRGCETDATGADFGQNLCGFFAGWSRTANYFTNGECLNGPQEVVLAELSPNADRWFDFYWPF